MTLQALEIFSKDTQSRIKYGRFISKQQSLTPLDKIEIQIQMDNKVCLTESIFNSS